MLYPSNAHIEKVTTNSNFITIVFHCILFSEDPFHKAPATTCPPNKTRKHVPQDSV